MGKKKSSKKTHRGGSGGSPGEETSGDAIDQLLSADLTESSPRTDSPKPIDCPHASRALRLVRIIRKLKVDKKGDCKDCEKDKNRTKSLLKTNAESSSVDDSPVSVAPSVSMPTQTSWLCLHCCLTHCGRYDKGHAQAHFESNKHLHCLVMNIDNLDFWCYQCDDQLEAGPKKNKALWDAKCRLASLLSKPPPKPHVSASTLSLSDALNGQDFEKQVTEKDLQGSKPPQKGGVPGLVNLGNTCFFNSVCQCLIHTPSLHSYFAKIVSGLADDGVPPSSTPILYGLNELLLNMNKKLENGWTEPYNPKTLLRPVSQKWRVYAQLRQQDSHELLLRLLDGMTDELKPKKGREDAKLPKEKTTIESLFGGLFTSCIVCDVCKDVSETQEDYLVLSVSIPTADNLPQSDTDDLAEKIQSLSIKTHTERLLHPIELPFSSNKGGAIRLESCLAQFMEVEVLDNQRACDNCYKLEYGFTRSEAEKKAKEKMLHNDPVQTVPDGDVASDVSSEDTPEVPPPLIRKGYKIYVLKSTPPFLVIHLKRFQQTGLFGRTQKLDAAIEFDEYLDTMPFILPSQGAEQDGIIPTRYKLYGIVVHSGSLFGGHYIAYIRHRQDGKDDEWVYCSDSHTRTVPWDIVKKCQAYMFFYERIEQGEKNPVEV